MSERVSIREVGLRDGLQLVRAFLATESKIDWLKAQAGCGFAEMEVTSFVPARVIPQFADADDVLAAGNGISGLLATALVLNEKGAERALAAGARKVSVVVSVSESHSRANANCSTDEAMARLERIVALVGDKVSVCAILATSFGCSMEGRVDVGRVVDLAARMVAWGADEVSLADTVGMGDPASVKALFRRVGEAVDVPLAAHFHDTRGMGLANICAALEEDVRAFDASLAGLGGCPFAPGASGNVATEDVVHMLSVMGFETGVDLDGLMRVREKLEFWLPDERLEGRLAKAGPVPWLRG